MTNQELYQTVSEGTRITKEVTDIILELDATSSVTTQAEVNKLLAAIYERLDKDEIIIEAISDSAPATGEQFGAWIDENIDPYSAKMFHESQQA